MPRSLIVGNSKLTVTLDRLERIRDVFYPMVGLENHVTGHELKIGVWVDSRFSWLGDDWEIKQKYLPDTLVGRCFAKNKALGISLEINDAVHSSLNIFIKKVELHNDSQTQREIRLFFSQDFHIYGMTDGDTVMYEPGTRSVIHYKRQRYFLINGETDTHEGIHQFSTGYKESNGREGSWKDAEDGELQANPIAQGAVDSVVSFRVEVPPDSTRFIYYWIACGENIHEVENLDSAVKKTGVEHLLLETENFGSAWVSRQDVDLTLLPGPARRLYKTSLHLMRSHVDGTGATVASCDSDVPLAFGGTYSYVWPRDGAMTALAFSLAGFQEGSRLFFQFCNETIDSKGFFYHKYLSDGSLGSSWLSQIDSEGRPQLAIQEDETALVLYSLWRHFQQFHDLEFIARVYDNLVVKASDFLLSYRDEKTGLPKPSFDLWEEKIGVFTATTATVCAALTSAARFAQVFYDSRRQDMLNAAANRMKEAMLVHLYDKELGRFIKAIYPGGDRDTTPDSSVAFTFLCGTFKATDEVVEKTMETLFQHLWVKTAIGGMARYENDDFVRVSREVPGNPWFISSLWLARWRIARAASLQDLSRGMELISWTVEHSLESGVLAEQINPYTAAPVSVAPLTWSHAEYVTTVCEYINKFHRLSTGA